MAPKPGMIVAARTVTVARVGRTLRTDHEGELRYLELWDQAPLSATPSGYRNPWWARDTGDPRRWYIVSAPRAGQTVRLNVIAYDVTEEVRLRESALRADPTMVRTVLRANGYGRSPLAALGSRSRVGESEPIRALLDSPIV